MKKILFILSCFLAPFVSNSQVQITLNNQNPMRFASSDVWKMNVHVFQEGVYTVVFDAQIRNGQGQLVSILESNPVKISSGVNSFNPLTIQTKSIKYGSGVIGEYENNSGHLPPGNYNYCIRVRCADQNCINKLKIEESLKACNNINIPPATPLLLSIPKDKAKLKIKRPNFTWIAPMPIGSEPEISYKMTLVKLREGQSANSGIRRNRALYEQTGIKGTVLAFPAELDDLEINTSYAWKVDAYLGDQYITTSQVWEFEIIEEKEHIVPMPFVRLKKNDHAIYNAVGELKFIYSETLRKNKVSFKITDSKGKNMNVDGKILDTQLGQNKFKLALDEFNLSEEEVYKLEIRQMNGELYSLSFKYYVPQ